MPKFSIITACFNSASSIEATFKSVKALTNYFDIQHIFVDGCSSDGTQDLLQKFNQYPHCEVIIEHDDGIFDAMNKGADLAGGDFLLFLNSDDSYVFDACMNFLSSISTDDEIIFADIILHDDGCQIPIRSRYPKAKWQFYNLPIHHPSSAVRRDIFLRLRKFNLSYKYSSDFDFFLRAFIHNVKFKYLHEYPTIMSSGGAGSIHEFVAMKEQRHSLFANKCYVGLVFAYIRCSYRLFWSLFNQFLGRSIYSKWRIFRTRILKNL